MAVSTLLPRFSVTPQGVGVKFRGGRNRALGLAQQGPRGEPTRALGLAQQGPRGGRTRAPNKSPGKNPQGL